MQHKITQVASYGPSIILLIGVLKKGTGVKLVLYINKEEEI